MGKQLFRRCLFGFKKKDVNEYISQISTDFSAKLAEKEKGLKETAERLGAAHREIDDLRARLSELDAMKDRISAAIIKAEENAAQIIAQAKRDASRRVEEIKAEARREELRLHQLRQNASYIQRSVTELTRRFNADLGKFSEAAGEEEKSEG